MPRSKGDRSESSNRVLLASLLFIVSLVFFGFAYVNPALGTQSGIPTGPQITASPLTLFGSGVVSVSGSGFAANGAIYQCVSSMDFVNSPACWPAGAYFASSTGTIANVYVPISCCVHAPPQIYNVYVVDVSSGQQSNPVAITIQAATTTTSVQSSTTTSYSTTITAPPTISLSPSSLPSTGGQVQFTASGFTPNGPIQFNVQGPTPFYSFSWQATANSNGQTVFNYNMQALISGTYSVTATDSVSGLASNSAQFTIAQVATTTASSSASTSTFCYNHY